MSPSPILSVIQPVTIDTMLNNNGLEKDTRKQGFKAQPYKGMTFMTFVHIDERGVKDTHNTNVSLKLLITA